MNSMRWASLLLLVWAPLALHADESQEAPRPAYVAPKLVDEWVNSGTPVMFLDVREADEFAAGHIGGAVNIRHDQVVSSIGQLPHDHPIVLYCIHSAHRAPEAAKRLREHGFANIHVLEGGIVAWQAAGLSIRSSDLAGSPSVLMKTERCEEAARQ